MKQLRSASLKLILSFVLVGSLFAPFVSKAQTTDTITVAAAIANNTGTATVEGYIVGHTTGTNSYDQEAPFSNDYNLAIADSPTETDPAKIVPVQLTTEFRSQFGLQTNPDLIGSKIHVTGSLEPYFTVPGVKAPAAITFVETEPSPEDPGDRQILTIAEAKTKTGQKVTIQGVVTADNDAIGGGRLSTYMQDETGGINIFASDPSAFPALAAGDLVEVTGEITSYNGLTEVVPETDGIQVLAENQPLPTPQTITLADFINEATAELLEGTLVQVEGYVQSVPGSPAGGGYNVTIVDQEFNGTTLRVMEGTSAIAAIEEGKWYSFTGIMSQYNSYQLLPRSRADIVLLENQPPAPDPAGEYEAVVSRVVDGDTINIETPVLGTTSVRFVNIDTPETYQSPKNELDQNQLDHGLAAKEYMNSLLQPGDEVIIKVGEEPLDDYGRLLAQVIRKDDNLNTNLEMVQKGYAVTYFIWPVGNIDEYEMYQAAVREANQAGLGIWNPEDPLLELPFVFRAREQGGGLDKPVGHSDTKEYVAPELWESVPVDKRIFFWSEADAQAAGFTPADGSVSEDPDEAIGSFTFKTEPGNGRKTKLIVSGQELKDLRAGQLTIQFDEKALTFLGAESLTSDVTTPAVSQEKGEVELAFAKLGASALEGNQDVLALTFVQKGKADQAWNIQVKDIILANSEGNEAEQAGFIYYFSGETASLSADLNGDGQVSLADLALLSTFIGTETEIEKADLNQDGRVDEKDYDILIKAI